MNPSAVLIVAPRKLTELADAMFECGLTPVFRDTILAAIAAMRKERFLAVVVDEESSEVDPLEVVLNIRDVDGRIRIFVLVEEDKKTDQSPYQKFVATVHLEELVRKLTPTTVPVSEALCKNTSSSGTAMEAGK